MLFNDATARSKRGETDVENFFVGESGGKWNKCLILHQLAKFDQMSHLLGEYECKLDAKSRMVLPAALKRQMPDVEREGLVLNRGFEKCLVIYTRGEWNKIIEKLDGLNSFDRKVRDFKRKFMRGATELNLDASGRVLIPKALAAYAGVRSEVVLACQVSKVELWDKKAYDAMWEDDEGDDFAALGEMLMGGLERRSEDA